MKKLFICILLLVPINSVFAQSFNDETEITEFTDRLMGKIVKKEFQEAFDLAKPYWPIPEIEVDGAVNQINQQWPLVDQRFGNSIGFEFVKEERIGASFYRRYYLQKFEKHAIYWQFSFYQASEGWAINTLIFLDNLETLYE